jgi:hypothetical protein
LNLKIFARDFHVKVTLKWGGYHVYFQVWLPISTKKYWRNPKLNFTKNRMWSNEKFRLSIGN